MRHVDVVWNRPVEGFREVVARLSVNDEGKLAVDQVSNALGPFAPKKLDVEGRSLDPARPEDFIEHLHEAIADSYVFATAAHDVADCPFPDGRAKIFDVAG